MTKKEKKYYVVWEWRNKWVFDNRDLCKEQIHQFPWAKYISFSSKELAEKAFLSNSNEFIWKKEFESTLSKEELEKIWKPILESICVDWAWNTDTGDIEYQCVDTKTKQLIFRKWPYCDWTNNIAEFLWLIHALAYCKKNNLNTTIYTDSMTAISWVRKKKALTKLQKNDRNKELFELVERAENWLNNNSFSNRILKWETRGWWEIPADFGRK